MKANIIKNKFTISKKKNKIDFRVFDVNHGMINSTAYVMEKIAYISDCKEIPKKNLFYLANLNFLIIDCLKFEKHPSHLDFDSAMDLINLLKPKNAILTNLHTDIDYFELKKKLPKNVVPAYDGLSFSF